ncbi:hemerythrin domain-containing protein [Castellaniella sp. GW247-6E4]|uniref:hemerythrin domain-containing protein n=1 Tax=Castellaniella sp. GW247-6E4 TaxID=3140380 RepID=UPI003315B349
MPTAATPPLPPAIDPIEALAARHAETRRHCEALRRLAAGGGAATGAKRAAELLAYFDGPARQAREDQEQDLFPALIESMAGSDAVCLRGMTEGLRAERARLDGIWRARMRPALAQMAAGAPTTLDEAEAGAWAEDFHRHLQMADEELLPMAARLLADDVLAELSARWREAQAAPRA